VGATLGNAAQTRYEIIIEDPARVARHMKKGLAEVERFRRERNDAFHFNGLLKIDEDVQHPFDPTHENMAALALRRDTPPQLLAANLRRAFSGIVAGNVKEHGRRPIDAPAPRAQHGAPQPTVPLGALLAASVGPKRVELPSGRACTPCYRAVR